MLRVILLMTFALTAVRAGNRLSVLNKQESIGPQPCQLDRLPPELIRYFLEHVETGDACQVSYAYGPAYSTLLEDPKRKLLPDDIPKVATRLSDLNKWMRKAENSVIHKRLVAGCHELFVTLKGARWAYGHLVVYRRLLHLSSMSVPYNQQVSQGHFTSIIARSNDSLAQMRYLDPVKLSWSQRLYLFPYATAAALGQPGLAVRAIKILSQTAKSTTDNSPLRGFIPADILLKLWKTPDQGLLFTTHSYSHLVLAPGVQFELAQQGAWSTLLEFLRALKAVEPWTRGTMFKQFFLTQLLWLEWNPAAAGRIWSEVEIYATYVVPSVQPLCAESMGFRKAAAALRAEHHHRDPKFEEEGQCDVINFYDETYFHLTHNPAGYTVLVDPGDIAVVANTDVMTGAVPFKFDPF